MSGAPYLVKLVRDRVGQFLGGEGRTEYRPVPPERHIELLRAKLVEEAVEYLQHPSVGELADILEVVDTLAALDPELGAPGACRGKLAVVREQTRKRSERGGLVDGMGMYVTTVHPTDGER